MTASRRHRVSPDYPWHDVDAKCRVHGRGGEYRDIPPASEPEEIVLCRYERWMECPFGGSEKCQAPEHATFRRKP